MVDGSRNRARVVVIGDLVVDIVVKPASSVNRMTDVVGEVQFRQGGSAATTARWLAHLGLHASLITSVGRDLFGDALVAYLQHCNVVVHVARRSRVGTGRMGVLLDMAGERSFVADRRAAMALPVAAVRRSWLVGAQALHVPAYCIFGEPLASATRHTVGLARQAGALLSIDLASTSFILAHRPEHVRDQVAALAPELLVGTLAEATALLGHDRVAELTSIAPLAIVKRGGQGATVFRRAEPVESADVPTSPLAVEDTTGAGDAFMAGILQVWLRHGEGARAPLPVLATAVRAGHRAATRELLGPRPELCLDVPTPGEYACRRPAAPRTR